MTKEKETRSKWENRLQIEQASLWLLSSLTLSKSVSRECRDDIAARIRREFKVSHSASFRIFDEAWRTLKKDFDEERMVLLRTMIKELSDIYYQCKEEQKYSFALKALSQMAQIVGLESRNTIKVESTTRELEALETQVLLEAVSGSNSHKS